MGVMLWVSVIALDSDVVSEVRTKHSVRVCYYFFVDLFFFYHAKWNFPYEISAHLEMSSFICRMKLFHYLEEKEPSKRYQGNRHIFQ